MTIEVGLDADDTDAEELEELTRRVRRRLLALDVGAIERPLAGESPEGTKGLDPVTLGMLIVTVARRRGAIAAVLDQMRAWAVSGRTVRIELDGDVIELGRATEEEQRQLVQSFVAKHGDEARSA